MVVVFGELGSGLIPFSKDLTLLRAINATGGITDFSGTTILLIRSGTVTGYNAEKLYRQKIADVPLSPWDIVLLRGVQGIAKQKPTSPKN